MKLVYYPNKALSTKCEPVTEFNDELKELVTKMTDIMVKHNALGLAANQVGVLKRVLLVRTNKGPIEPVINPEIIDVDNEEILLHEGCLSAPGVTLPVKRPKTVHFKYKDLEGNEKKAVAFGMDGRALLHEIDHLEGITFFDKVSPHIRAKAIKNIKR